MQEPQPNSGWAVGKPFKSQSSVSDVHGDEQLHVISKLMIWDGMRFDELSDWWHVRCEEQ